MRWVMNETGIKLIMLDIKKTGIKNYWSSSFVYTCQLCIYGNMSVYGELQTVDVSVAM